MVLLLYFSLFFWKQFWSQKWLKADLCRWELWMVPFKFFAGSTILYGCWFGWHTIYSMSSLKILQSALFLMQRISLLLCILCMHEHFHFHAWLAAYWDISDSMFSSLHAHVDLHIFFVQPKTSTILAKDRRWGRGKIYYWGIQRESSV